MSAPKFTPTEEQLARIAVEIPLRVLDAIYAMEGASLRPGRQPTLLRRVVEAIWRESPMPALHEALEACEASLSRISGLAAEGAYQREDYERRWNTIQDDAAEALHTARAALARARGASAQQQEPWGAPIGGWDVARPAPAADGGQP